MKWISSILSTDICVLYSAFHRFLFITESEEFTAELFSDPYVQKHSKVAAVRKVFGPEEHFINFGYNFFQPGHVIPTFVWSPVKNMKNRNQIFTPMEDFQGFQFDVKTIPVKLDICVSLWPQVGVLPWAHHVQGDKVEAAEEAPATYTNYWGYEIELLRSIASSLNFTYKFRWLAPVKISDDHDPSLHMSATWRTVSGATSRPGPAARSGTGWWPRQPGGTCTSSSATCSSPSSGAAT